MHFYIEAGIFFITIIVHDSNNILEVEPLKIPMSSLRVNLPVATVYTTCYW